MHDPAPQPDLQTHNEEIPPYTVRWPETANPMGTDGFEFVEYASQDPKAMAQLFASLGFRAVARHRSKDVTLFRQGDVHFILNGEANSFARRFAEEHGPSACAMAFRVKDAAKAYAQALELGAKPATFETAPMEIHVPAIHGIGGSLIYFIDRYGPRTIYDVDFVPIAPNANGAMASHEGAGLLNIDHLTHNVAPGQMDTWTDFYHRIFNFRQIRYFDIRGKKTGLISRALASPCGKIKIPINESPEPKSQINEFIQAYGGEGIQHIALSCNDIFATVEQLSHQGVAFLKTPDTYYELLNKRLPGHNESMELMQKHKILIDGDVTPNQNQPSLLLQIFTENVIGPIFFEIIQRKGNEGFGEGNFQALFESIELDQIRRGVLN